jgi:hypothetical protein
MIKLLLIFITFITFSATIRTDAEFTPYVREFLRQAKIRNVNLGSFDELDIRFSVKLNRLNFNGFSPNIFGRKRLVLIEPFAWKQFSKGKRLMLIIHELGHALLHRKHEDPYVSSVMIAYAISHLSDIEFLEYNKFYWDELFSKRGTLQYIPDQW